MRSRDWRAAFKSTSCLKRSFAVYDVIESSVNTKSFISFLSASFTFSIILSELKSQSTTLIKGLTAAMRTNPSFIIGYSIYPLAWFVILMERDKHHGYGTLVT